MKCGESVTWRSMRPQPGLAGGRPGDAWVTAMPVGGLCRGSVKAVRALLSLALIASIGSIFCTDLDEIWVEAVALQAEKSKYCDLQSLPLPPFLGSCCGAGSGADRKSKCLVTALGTISVLHLIALV